MTFRNLKLPANNSPAVFLVTIGQTVAEVERELILRTLRYFNGDKSRAAHELGIARKTLYNKLRVYGEMDRLKPKDSHEVPRM